MPIANISILEGRTDDQKRLLIAKVTDAIAEALNAPKPNIRVLIQEVPKTQWGIEGQTVADREAAAKK